MICVWYPDKWRLELSPRNYFQTGPQHPFPINLLFFLPLVGGLEGRLKTLRTLNKVGFEKTLSLHFHDDPLALRGRDVIDIDGLFMAEHVIISHSLFID